MIAARAEVAARWWGQLRGRIGRETELADVALGLPNCPQVHTAFVREPLDVALCAADGTVLRLLTLRPWHVSPWVRGAAVAWEMRAGLLAPYLTEGESRLVLQA